MTRPKVNHDGFLVPNAGGLAYPRMAEVDQIDFNTLSQSRWAVVEGCLVTVSGTTATTLGGTVVVNGTMVTLVSGSAQLGVGGQQDRFDLVVAGSDGNLRVIPGAPGFDPVLPDPTADETALAAVFCPTGQSNFTDYVIDKRVSAPHALLTRRTASEYLVRNVYNPPMMTGDGGGGTGPMSNLFSVRGDGLMTWVDDTVLYREDVATLRVNDNINLRKNLQAGGDGTFENVYARNLVFGKNIFNAAAPSGGEPLGAIWQDSNTGRIYVNTDGGWVELATVLNTAPVGQIIQTVREPVNMPSGWVPLDGTSVNEADHPSLFTLPMLYPWITGVQPNRVLATPDLTDRTLVGTKTAPTLAGSNSVTLLQANLPSHVHGVTVRAGGGFSPTGTIGQAGGHSHGQAGSSGEHSHGVVDPGHKHNGMEMPGMNSQIVALVWGGQNKIDALFNDRNHTYSVEALDWTAAAFSGITIASAGSGHSHVLIGAPDHAHPLTLNAVPEHGHGVVENPVGSSIPVDVRQASFSVFMYIKA